MNQYDATRQSCIGIRMTGASRYSGGNLAPNRKSCLSLQRKSNDVSGVLREGGSTIREYKESYSNIFDRSTVRIRQNSFKSLQDRQLEQSFRIEVVGA